MRGYDVSERIALVDLDLDLAARNHVEHILSERRQILIARRISHECRARDIERSFCRENSEVDTGYRPGSVAEADHQAARPQAVERGHEARLPDAIVDHRHTSTARDLFDAL